MPDSLAPPSVPLSSSSSSSSSSLSLNDSSDCPSMLFSDSLSSDSYSDISDSLSDPPPRASVSGDLPSEPASLSSHSLEQAPGTGSQENTPKASCCAVFGTEDAGYEADFEGRHHRKCFVHVSLAGADHQRKVVPRRRRLSLLACSTHPPPPFSPRSPLEEGIRDELPSPPVASLSENLPCPAVQAEGALHAKAMTYPAPQRPLSPRLHYIRGSLGHPQQYFNRWQRMDYQHRNVASLGSSFPSSQSYDNLTFDSFMLMAEQANSHHARRHSVSGLL
ncbi:hypothetical protein NEOLEDRAFT_1182544 [Neolentinus lepideus HHB14362 ss-1]|uniref:Uncharacterized protein n=1 Tax=Neolentinus lepideus HHB14362 ss-1 TaxID=1314782 RepID=A0A165P3S6_9AGAM|nr:hypothetical protein NEOLEDRAFT_1182544 [Neolentinus lepideus HHB14362 ss-1]